jgi:hypothetical protein
MKMEGLIFSGLFSLQVRGFFKLQERNRYA